MLILYLERKFWSGKLSKNEVRGLGVTYRRGGWEGRGGWERVVGLNRPVTLHFNNSPRLFSGEFYYDENNDVVMYRTV